MKLSEAMREKMLLSFELFPPKTEKGMENLPGTIEHLMKYKPEYISCTYGAGGGKTEKRRRAGICRRTSARQCLLGRFRGGKRRPLCACAGKRSVRRGSGCGGYVPRGIGGPAGRDQAFAQCGGVCRSSDLGFVYENAQARMRGRTIDIKRRTAQAGAALVLYA